MKNKQWKAALCMLLLGGMVSLTTLDVEAEEAVPEDLVISQETESLEATDEAESVEEVSENEPTKEGWVKEEDGIRYYVDGSYIHGQTMNIEGNWYYFKTNGVMAEQELVTVWEAESRKYYCAGKNGILLVNQWYYEDDSAYYFTENGEGANGLQVINDTKYYFSNGCMVRNHNLVDGDKCYVINKAGAVYEAKNNAWTTVDGVSYYVKDYRFLSNKVEKIGSYYFGFDQLGQMYDDVSFEGYGSNGKRAYFRARKGGRLYTSTWYENCFYTKDGTAPDGLRKLGNVLYFFRYGMAISDEYVAVNGKLYHADSNCALKEIVGDGLYYEDANRAKFVYVENHKLLMKKWKKIDGTYYYFDADGYACRYGRHEIDGKNFFFNHDGTLVTDGWVKDWSETYYASASGELFTGDHKIDGKWYYFNAKGWMQTGLVQTDTGYYLYGEDGAYIAKAKKGWNEIRGAWYYFDGEAFVKDKLMTIGKETYYFTYGGKMMTDDIRTIRRNETGYEADTRLFNSKGCMVKQGWYEIAGKWYYVDPTTENVVWNEERVIDGKTYVFGYSGMLVSDCVDPFSHKTTYGADTPQKPVMYSFASTGELIEKKGISDGWTLHGGTWYYYRNGLPANGWIDDCYVKAGVMLRSTDTPDGYWVGQDGAYQKKAGWVKVNNEQENGMYVKTGGKLAKNEWLKISGKWYYFRDYTRVSGARRIDGVWYIFGDDGACQSTIGKSLKTGWKKAGNDWYYFKGGALVNGSLTLGGKDYSFKDSRMIGGPGFEDADYTRYYSTDDAQYYNTSEGTAERIKGWKKINGKWYCFGINYKIDLNSWFRDGKKLYYQTEGGIVTGVQLIDRKLYQFGSDGALVKTFDFEEGWQKIAGKWYYFFEGSPITSMVKTYAGKTYLFREDGTLACNERISVYAGYKDGGYYADKNGVIVRNKLVMIDGHAHYFGADGFELRGVWKINGKTYYLDY